MLRPDGVKEKRYCGFHDRNSHSINECRVFRMRIQKAIQEGHLKFDNKMKLDGNPFPQNMIGFSVSMVNAVEEKGKVKVLTSAKAKQDGSVDPARQVTFEQIHKGEPRFLKSQIEVGESSKPRVTLRILLNKWLSYGPPWAHYLDGYLDRLVGGPLGLPDLCCTAPAGVKHKDYRGEVLR
jgi:hypothetical protein